MRLSAVQMNAGPDKAANIAEAGRLIEAAIAGDRPALVGLPEIWTCIGGDRANRLAQAETLPPPGSSTPAGPAYEFLRATARRHAIHLHGGSLIEAGEEGAGEGGRLFNTTLVFNPAGEEIARYRKIHLFDTRTPDGQIFGESRSFGAGDRLVTYEAHGIRIGCAICYDLRFPELFLALRRAGAELILLPSAFTQTTGMDHWEPLPRARAIETQCWIAAPALCGRHLEGSRAEPRASYGHTLIADPWGHVVALASDGPGWATARIDRALTARVRRDMPVLDHHVLDHHVLGAGA
jgi:nitrilase